MTTKYVAKNTVTGKWFDGSAFNLAPVRGTNAKVLTEQQALVVKHTYENVELVPVTTEPTDEEKRASEAKFLQWARDAGVMN